MAGRDRYVRKCLAQTCQHVFVTSRVNGGTRCPKCGNSPVGSVRKGDEVRWPLKEAKSIARMIRGDQPDSDTAVEDLKADTKAA